MDLDDLPVSHIFKGNLWRLIALCGLLEAKKATSTLISKVDLEKIENQLQVALTHFMEDESQWGLGLTYNLLGRVWSFRKMFNFEKAKHYLDKALECFKSIDHCRGMYITLKDLHDV